MLSLPFYIFYILISFCGPFFLFSDRFKLISFLSLILCAQFNVTTFFKLGITISFFEINLILCVIIILMTTPTIFKNIIILKMDKVLIFLILFSFLSILIALFRIEFKNLIPFSYSNENPLLRSLMSLNKVIFYFPFLIIVRTYFSKHFKILELKNYFLIGLILSGILPALSIIIQFLGLDFIIIKNNPSFAEEFRLINFMYGERPFGLTNEASFFSYQLFFSFIF